MTTTHSRTDEIIVYSIKEPKQRKERERERGRKEFIEIKTTPPGRGRIIMLV